MTPGTGLRAFGTLVACAGVFAGVMAAAATEASSWVVNATNAALVGGVPVVAGAVLHAAGAVVAALATSRPPMER